ncbi:MAG: hypothetical protein LUH15_17515 [Tannerellaceae bacterium]|nr:hypothetical protein [Tannerellaceae bacterium]
MSNNKYVPIKEYNLFDVISYINSKPEYQEIDLIDFNELLDDMLNNYESAKIVITSVYEDRKSETIPGLWELVNNSYFKNLLLIISTPTIGYELQKNNDGNWSGIYAYIDLSTLKSPLNLSDIRELINSKIKK